MRLRVVRWMATVAVGAAATFGCTTPAEAQIAPPALPVVPVPAAAQPLLNLLAPVASPVCGNALLLAVAGPGLIPATPAPLGLAALIGSAFAPIFVACASVPVPAISTQLQCALDDQVLAALSTLTLAALGSGPPVSTRAVGPIVELTFGLQGQLPAQLQGLGAAEQLSSALACRLVHPSESTRPSDLAAVADTTGDQLRLPSDVFDFGLSPALGGGAAPVIVGSTRPTRSIQRAATVAAARPFSYPFVFVLPLLLLALGGYLARCLTDEVRLPQR